MKPLFERLKELIFKGSERVRKDSFFTGKPAPEEMTLDFDDHEDNTFPSLLVSEEQDDENFN